jgi:putative Holliday junction resolvase
VDASKRPDQPPQALLALIDELDPALVVVGIPLQMDGSEGEMAREARAFAQAVARESGRPVTEWDERLTTSHAEREIRSFDLPASRKREKGLSDRIAAALLLRGYLEGHEGNAVRGEDEST